MLSSSNVRVGRPHDIARRMASARKAAPFWCWRWFVDEDEAIRVEIDLPFERIFRRGIYIAAPLLGGVHCLFLSVIFLRWKKRQSEVMLADIPRRFNRSATRRA
jgi:hypothetical protein